MFNTRHRQNTEGSVLYPTAREVLMLLSNEMPDAFFEVNMDEVMAGDVPRPQIAPAA